MMNATSHLHRFILLIPQTLPPLPPRTTLLKQDVLLHPGKRPTGGSLHDHERTEREPSDHSPMQVTSTTLVPRGRMAPRQAGLDPNSRTRNNRWLKPKRFLFLIACNFTNVLSPNLQHDEHSRHGHRTVVHHTCILLVDQGVPSGLEILSLTETRVVQNLATGMTLTVHDAGKS